MQIGETNVRRKTVETNSSKKDETHFSGKYSHSEHDDDNHHSQSRGHPDRLDRFNLRTLHVGSPDLLSTKRPSFAGEVHSREHVLNTTGTNRRLLVFGRNVGVEEAEIVAIYVNGTSLPPTG